MIIERAEFPPPPPAPIAVTPALEREAERVLERLREEVARKHRN
jgi:hypothetical protein